MFIERLQRDLAICSAIQITPFLAKEPGRWHVVSIREPIQTESVLTLARSIHPMVFEDVLTTHDELGRGPTAAHLAAFMAYVAGTGREPLVLQCWAGRSRSAAVALVVIVKELSEAGLEGADLVQAAVDILVTLRPQALPNALVLRLGLEQFLPAPLGETLSKALMREPRIRKNFG